MTTKDLDSRLVDVTVGEALEIARPYFTELLAQVLKENRDGTCQDEFGHGLKAIQEVFGCSPAKAVDLHHDTRFASAIYDDGRKIIVNKTRLYQLLEEERKRQLRLIGGK